MTFTMNHEFYMVTIATSISLKVWNKPVTIEKTSILSSINDFSLTNWKKSAYFCKLWNNKQLTIYFLTATAVYKCTYHSANCIHQKMKMLTMYNAFEVC